MPLRFKKPMFQAELKRIQRDSQETKHCRVENDTKSVSSRFLSASCMALILVFTQSS